MAKMLKLAQIICVHFFCLEVVQVAAFGILATSREYQHNRQRINRFKQSKLHAVDDQQRDDDGASLDDISGSSYQSSGSVTKRLVSSLTALTNSVLQSTEESKASKTTIADSSSTSPPASPQELLTRIRNEYTQNNYLWTGNLDTSSFVSNCTFTDPTLSFVGVDKYIDNVGNLVPVVNFLLGEEQYSKSDLLNISINEEEQYVETRWNMVGELNALFWKPKIDVIGRTKFWYQDMKLEKDDSGESSRAYQVYFYDEMWEIPAGLALLQLITKAGTIPNTNQDRS